MIIAYHAIFTTYGTWLPNDPRGSYSKQVYQRALAELAEIKYGPQCSGPERSTMQLFRTAAFRRLSRPPYYINGQTRPVVAEAFGRTARRLAIPVVACAIMNDHVHLIVLRTKYRIEYLMNQFKGAATSDLGLSNTPWTRKGWRVFLNDEDVLEAAVAYVQANPEAAGMAAQAWDVVTPLCEAYRRWESGELEGFGRTGDR